MGDLLPVIGAAILLIGVFTVISRFIGWLTTPASVREMLAENPTQASYIVTVCIAASFLVLFLLAREEGVGFFGASDSKSIVYAPGKTTTFGK